MTVAVRPKPVETMAPARAAAEPCLTVRGLTKRYGGLVAVKDIDLDLRPGEILGLIGPNGSGKSTVMKLIMGLERPSAGSIRLDGAEIGGMPAHRVARSGIGLVFQHARPLQRQTVLENISLALLPDSLIRLAADPHVAKRAREIAERVGLGAVIDRRPGTLPFADLRRLELAKAIARDPRVVLVDEPFAGLTGGEVAAFSELIRGFRDEGKAVLLVDHNVKSVSALVDRVFAMYLGERIAEGSAESVMADPTVRRVYLGGSIETAARPEAAFKPDSLLTVETVDVLYGKAQALRGASIHVHEGEFVSVVGLNGAGKTTLFNAISGLVPHTGTIRFDGQDLTRMKPAAIARAGIVQVPETRELFGDLSVRENLDLGGQHFPKAESAQQREWLYELFPILKAREAQSARTLSGGEQQMLTIARALMMRPRLLILDEPTLGLAPVILELLSKALEKLRQTTPITVLLGEQNVTFALPHADRVYVLEQARIVWEGPPDRFASEMGAAYL
jgi:ABC-type branched-subunit amino acid transport system ATPase component